MLEILRIRINVLKGPTDGRVRRQRGPGNQVARAFHDVSQIRLCGDRDLDLSSEPLSLSLIHI